MVIAPEKLNKHFAATPAFEAVKLAGLATFARLRQSRIRLLVLL